jgi:hypothetical protein
MGNKGKQAAMFGDIRKTTREQANKQNEGQRLNRIKQA